MEAFIRDGGLPEHYRCEIVNKTQAEWSEEGEQNIPHGIACLIYGVTCQILYIPCVIVFLQRDLIALPVYQLMLFITICDMIQLTTDSVFGGIFFIEGAVYCNYPMFMYLWGCFQVAAWAGSCVGCFFLVLTRLVDTVSRNLYLKLFGGNRVWFMHCFLFSYVLFFYFFARPVLFNSKWRIWAFDPLIYSDGREYAHYISPPLVFNNIGTVTSTLLMSIAFIFFFAQKMKSSYNFSLDRKQMQILFQSFAICFNNLIVAIFYVLFQYIPVSPAVTLACLIVWQYSNGSGLLVFYGMNRTVRRRVAVLLGFGKSAKVSVAGGNNSSQPKVVEIEIVV